MYRLRYHSRRVSITHSVSSDNVEFGSFANVAHHAQIANSKIGKRTSIGRYTKIRNAEIGNYCSTSWDVTIGATSHPMSHASTHSFGAVKNLEYVIKTLSLIRLSPIQVMTYGLVVMWSSCPRFVSGTVQ